MIHSPRSGVSQRDPNYYEYLNVPERHESIRKAVLDFWEHKIRHTWLGGKNCTSCSLFHWSCWPNHHPSSYLSQDAFDIVLTRALQRANLIDFNPSAPRTDPLLFTYAELRDIYASSVMQTQAQASSPTSSLHETVLPVLRVIHSRSHPRAARNAPQNSHNMVPREALEMSAGRNILDFQGAWTEELKKAMADD